MNSFNSPNIIHVEIKLKHGLNRTELIEDMLRSELNDYFAKHKGLLVSGDVEINDEHSPLLQTQVESITIDRDCFDYSGTDRRIVYHIYRPHIRNVEVEMFESDPDADGEEVPASNHWLLPSNSLAGLWESLIYEGNLKEKLLKYAETSLVFARHNVNQKVICCNRIILLHGPPGTGKTSLCKAIAQKLSVRLMPMYKYTHLLEINSHSLFSKWFSESGKLVMKLFTKVREIIAQPNSLVCVLIDEVESIAYARDSMSGQEPKDAMRVVNALLTQLDSIKEFPNVLILATTNLASNIDLAFLDRADIKQHIGMPSVRAVYQIYNSMLKELMRVGIVTPNRLLPFEVCENNNLLAFAENSIGVSGRTLKKLPFLAHAIFIASSTHPIDVDSFIKAMESALKMHIADKLLLEGNNNK